MKFTGYVTVKLASKRVSQKSIQKIGGKTLVERAISTLAKVKEVSEVILYCSDERLKEYINPKLPYTFVKRDPKLDNDRVTFNEILESIIDKIETDYLIFLSCTSPFIRARTISEMIGKIKTGKFDSAFTAFEKKSFCWFKDKPLNYSLSKVPRTQDLQPIIEETSALYIFSKNLFKKYKRRIGFRPYIKIINIFEGWDIDTTEDLRLARMIVERRN